MYSSYSVAAATCSMVFPVLAGSVVYLRFRARKLKALPFKADDYLVLAALIFAIVLGCLVFEGSFKGSIGQSLDTLTPEEYTVLQKHLYLSVIFSHLAIGLVKCSVLMFYKRIFSTPQFTMSANIALVFVSLWILATFFTQIFSAWPVSNWWTFGKSFDMDYGAMITSFAVMDILLDLIILCLPLPVIRKLQMSRIRKFQVIGIFWMGTFCVIAASVRLYYSYELSLTGSKASVSFTGSWFQSISTKSLIWGQIEPCTSIIAACLPCMAALVRGGHSPESLVRSVRSIFKRSPASSTVSIRRNGQVPTDEESQKDESQRAWHKLQDIGNNGAVYTGGVETGEPAENLKGQDGIFMERSFAHTVEESRKEPHTYVG